MGVKPVKVEVWAKFTDCVLECPSIIDAAKTLDVPVSTLRNRLNDGYAIRKGNSLLHVRRAE